MRASVSPNPSRRRRCSGGPSVTFGSFGVGPPQRHQILVIDEVREVERHPAARRRCARAGTKRCTAAQRSNRSMLAAAAASGLLAREQRVQHRRERQLFVARDDQLGERSRTACATAVAQRRRLVGGQLVLGVLLAGAPDDEVLHPEDRRLARRRVELRLPRRLDAEQPRDERPQRPRHLDQQRRLLGRRQRRARRGTPRTAPPAPASPAASSARNSASSAASRSGS